MAETIQSETAMSRAIAQSRIALRERWQGEGWFTSESVAQRLARGVLEHPETAIHFFSTEGLRSTSTREILADGRRMAFALRQTGIRQGDVVAVQMPTRYETAVLYLATFIAGAVLLPIVHIYGPAEVNFILRRAKARALVVPDRWRKIDFLERLGGLGHLPDLEHIIIVGEQLPRGAISYRSLLDKATEVLEPAQQNPNDLALLLFTSGTTGEPKGVRQTHNTLCCEWGTRFYEFDGLFLNPAPAGHIQGFNMLMRPFVTGVPMLMMDQWNADEAAQLIARFRVVQSGGAPYFLHTLLEAAERGGSDLSSIRSFGMGAAAVTPEQVAMAERRGISAGRSYGSTEHSTVTMFKTWHPLERRMGTDGVLQPGVEVRIVDDNEREVPTGADGELLLRGPEQFEGYLDPAHDLGSFTPDGWFRSGDIARYDAEGFLTITDRKKDMIIRGGENISSMEVENLLLRHPAVAEVAVVAMPDERLGERVCAFVVARAGMSLTLPDLSGHCGRAGFAKQKTPERLVLVDEFPRTASGKVKKAELRARLKV